MMAALCALLIITPLHAQETPTEIDIDTIIAGMSLEQRVAQMFMVTLHGSVMTEQGARHLREWQPGGIVLFTDNMGNPAAMTRLTNAYQQTILDAGGVPLLISTDQEGGVVTRLTDGFTMFPTPLLLGAAGAEMSLRAGAATATELSAVGINMNLAPVADLETYAQNPIIARRSFGNDPDLTGEVIAAYVRGTQSMGVLATAKHFPGHGDTREDSHGTLPILDLTRERLDAVELAPFRAAIEADVAAIMVSHIWFRQIDPTPRMPASLSRVFVTDILRGDLGYDGLIMTDAMDMNAVDLEYNFHDALVMAVHAGVDLLAMGPSVGQPVFEAAMQRVVDEVRAGNISEARINESVRRILATKQTYDLFTWQPLDPAGAAARVNLDAHADLFTELYNAGVTVAYDRNNLVPIPPDRSVAIIFLATRYQIQHDCSTYRPDIRWVGVGDNPDAEQIAWAVEAANSSDIAVVCTQNAISNPYQQALVNALPP